MNKVKLILIALFILVLIGFLYAFFTRDKESQITTIPLPTPDIPKSFEGEQEIVFDFEEKDFDFPSTLPALMATPVTIPENESRKLANKLGLNFEPAVIPDVFEGKKHRYSGDDYVLLMALETGKIDYVRNPILGEIANKQLSDKDIIKIAEDFLFQNEIVEADQVFALSVSYYKESVEGLYQGERENAYFYQVNFSTTISDIPVITTNPRNSPVYVRVLRDGSILKAHIEKLGQVGESEQVFNLRNYDDVINSIEDAILISLDEGNVYLKDLPSTSTNKINITEIELAYLVEPSFSNTLQPIFLLKGKAGVAGFPNKVSATLYLPAISERR